MITRQRDKQEPQVKAKPNSSWAWFLEKFDDGNYQTNHIELRDRRERRERRGVNNK